MSRRHYIMFAEMYAGELALRKRDWAKSMLLRAVILSTADIFARDNALFNRRTFYKVCGLSEDGELVGVTS